MYLFPPGWLPCFSIGIGTSFLLQDYLKEKDSGAYSARKWGIFTDTMTFVLLVGWIGYGLTDSFAKPYFDGEMEVGARYWAAFVSRLICPIGFLWYVGLCIGRGATGWLLSGRIMVDWLAPASYNCFLFHGPISELYFRATRGVWWSFPKPFYWFSPYPVPVTNWEIPLVMAIVTCFSMVMHFFVNDKLVGACNVFLSCFEIRRTSTSDDEKSVASVVTEVIARTSNVDPNILTGETKLTDIGMSSMTLPVSISEINIALNAESSTKDNSRRLSSSLFSTSGATTVNDLISLASDTEDLNISRISTRSYWTAFVTGDVLFEVNSEIESGSVGDIEYGSVNSIG
jgi:hypothetical protein